MSTAEVQQHGFQAEVKQLLDIVIHSLYTDREIFIRELVSNASDALEKLRLKQLTEKGIYKADLPLEITITTDEDAKTLTIADHGIGMTREELQQNLGTIAHSGTKAFLEQLKEKGENNADVIGKFGVGFYSAFMAADEVEVYTHSWQEDAENLKWTSDGASGYSVEAVDEQARGCKIVIKLKEGQEEFAKAERVKEILEKYSNFVTFPINLNGERVNKVEALWMKSKSDVTEEEYKEFYKFVSHAWDEPTYTMHFSADAPLAINSLLFVPGENQEQFGMGQMEPGVALYCRKVLIDPKPSKLLPEWLRFLRGVIDSEDLPLNISRESMQDSALIQKLNKLITKRFLKFLERQAKDDTEKYEGFYKKFSRFLKEGIATSFEHQEQLAGLLRFESTMTDAGKLTSMSEYLDRAKDGQEEIYYLVGNSRELLEKGPYLEAFKARGLEVILFTDGVDQYVMDALPEFKGKKFVAADRADIDLEDMDAEGEALDEASLKGLTDWLGETLGERVEKVEAGKRLVNSPVAALAPKEAPNAQMRAMMKAMGQELPEPKVTLEVNPRSEVIKNLAGLKDRDTELAGIVAQQLTDNALLAAGLLENPQEMVGRLNDLLSRVSSEK
ncbi:molecular chaperone HtpG [Rubritalea squalenifaciens DSM 18772]|uniref:Chaperone protein HtpG n=1 Tax=Rubritalea squalenifaciens DSM 18772 TaxID=1123071 RepID=A0A1M6HN24_9BACT|nr:molecular chaperone HtpG [Rubritalea squalenifaciens]SHJ23569.1 molecular chaperone HtpG [Rubritalea squalenifaciens DSM 18772]